jgi:predicted aspartyl protease
VGDLTLIVKQDADEPEAAEIFVDGTIGAVEYRFLLDTGAARSGVMFDNHTSRLESLESSKTSGLFATSTEDLVRVPSIEVGPISKQDFTLVRAAESSLGAKNLIGMDLLKDWCLHFLFDEGLVSVTASDELSPVFALQELFLDRRFHPYIDVRCDSTTARAVWDTGASLTIADMALIESHPSCFQEVGVSSGTDSTGTEMTTPMFIASNLSIANQMFPPHRVAGVDLSPVNSTIETPMDMILGYSTLSKANWLFDFPRKRWAITKRLGDW